jgi:hypothetical protein
VLLALVLGLVGCDDPDVSGTWNGVGAVSAGNVSGNITITLNLDESDDAVTGTGTILGRTTISGPVSGSAKDDDVDLTITPTGYSPSRYQAKVDDDTMTGTWTEPGLTLALTLTRK